MRTPRAPSRGARAPARPEAAGRRAPPAGSRRRHPRLRRARLCRARARSRSRAEAGVGEPTIYRHFPSKRALFLAAFDRSSTELLERWRAIAAESASPLEAIGRIGIWYAEQLRARPARSPAPLPLARPHRGRRAQRARALELPRDARLRRGPLRAGARARTDRRVADPRTLAWLFMAVGAALDQAQMLGLGDELAATSRSRGSRAVEPAPDRTRGSAPSETGGTGQHPAHRANNARSQRGGPRPWIESDARSERAARASRSAARSAPRASPAASSGRSRGSCAISRSRHVGLHPLGERGRQREVVLGADHQRRHLDRARRVRGVSSQLRSMLRYQLMPPVKPVRSNASHEHAELRPRRAAAGRSPSSLSTVSTMFGIAAAQVEVARASSGTPLRISCAKTRRTSRASRTSASPRRLEVHDVVVRRRIAARNIATGGIGARGRNGVLTPITPATRSGCS